MGLVYQEDLKDKITENENIFIYMKSDDFKNIIRKIVVEEVKKEVQNQLPKLLFEMLGSKAQTITASTVSTTPKPKVALVKEHQTKTNQPPQQKPLKQYVKNPILNQILNETSPGLPQSSYGTSVLAGLDGEFDKTTVSDEFVGELNNILTEQHNPTHTPEPTNNSPTPGLNLSKLFNKPFKAILDKSKEKSGGGGFGGAVSRQDW
jgi:hypothetical protein